ncbi:VOC family protein [Puia dinghuensis]|uniref:VOC family protein n=1 Tax=Puia dinghuensis TaxID=1792502 RepID=A0A8J2XVD6_9BACT|nr:VOC family protein [Puia dinghuensis]GGB17674.1 VOC family protein [Puia dinghuensis]
MPTQLNVYLNFNGRCREAMTFYQQCLGGDLALQRIAESPMAAQMPSAAGANILHSSLTRNGTLLLLGSDMIGANIKQGNSVALCLNCSTDQEINTFFNNLSAGGEIRMPLHQSFWGSTYGELTDKFGMNWMLNYTKN